MKVKVGIIGCGRIAQRFHVKHLTQLADDAELIALCDERVEIANELALRYKIKKVFKDYTDLLNDKEIDAVVISTPPESHFKIMRDAATAGKHIFVEKPLANTVEECEEITKICQKNNVKLMVGFMRRFDKALAWSHEKIKSGEIGKTFVINSSYNLVSTYGEYLKTTDTEIVGKASPSQGYKANLHAFLINNLIHHTDISIWMGGPAERVLASSDFSDDHFTLNVIIKFKSQITGHIQFNGFIKTEWRESVTIHGTGGSIFVDMFFPYLTTPSKAVFVNNGGLQITPINVVNSMYKDEINYFLNCIQKNIEPDSNGNQATEAQKIVDGIEKSLKLETWVKVN